MIAHKPDVESAVGEILRRRASTDSGTSVLAGVSGSDASGKGFVTNRIIEHLLKRGIRAVGLHGDGWLNLPHRRFNPDNPGPHFYENALRLADMFEEWVLPLKRQRSHDGVMDFVEETADIYRKESYTFKDVDVIVLECIFLFKRRFGDTSTWPFGSTAVSKPRWNGRSHVVKNAFPALKQFARTKPYISLLREFTFAKTGLAKPQI